MSKLISRFLSPALCIIAYTIAISVAFFMSSITIMYLNPSTEVTLFLVVSIITIPVVYFVVKYLAATKNSSANSIVEHIRQVCLLYPLLLLFLVPQSISLVNNPEMNGEPGKVFFVVVTYIVALTIVVNLIVLLFRNLSTKHRNRYTSPNKPV